jgi:enoyl-CoA hydratase/carnithine racemase
LSSSSPSATPSGPGEAAGGRLLLDEPAPGVARLTIHNVAKRGALDHSILGAFATMVPQLEARCVIITGEGPMFSSGYDLRGVNAPLTGDDAERLIAHPFNAALQAIQEYPYPTVAVLNGHAIGGGLELAITCDLRIAADTIRLGMPPAKLGLIYSHTGIRKFLETVGAARTRELFLTGRRIDARTALAWNLVNEVTEPEALAEYALGLAREMATNAPLAQAGNKRVINELLQASAELDQDLERELIELRIACFFTDDFAEGVSAFAQRRDADFKGR